MSHTVSVDTSPLRNIEECPACGKIGNTHYVDSRYNKVGNVRIRRKECECGCRWSTAEVLYVDLDKLLNYSSSSNLSTQFIEFDKELGVAEQRLSELKASILKARNIGKRLECSNQKAVAKSTLGLK